MRSRRLRSPEALGLTLYSSKPPKERAARKIEVLKTVPLGDYRWKELAEEFQRYLDLFPYSPVNRPCRCGHPVTVIDNSGGHIQQVWVHIPGPQPGERACQPDGVDCSCKGYEPLDSKTQPVALAAYRVRAAARKARNGKGLPSWTSLERNLVMVFRFVQRKDT
jgi:hypothetical protein